MSIEREGRPRNIMYVDIGYVREKEEIWPPKDCTDEMVRLFNQSRSIYFSENRHDTRTRLCLLTLASLDYSTLDLPEGLAGIGYGGCQPIENLKLALISALWRSRFTVWA
jgi:hypothetical protein